MHPYMRVSRRIVFGIEHIAIHYILLERKVKGRKAYIIMQHNKLYTLLMLHVDEFADKESLGLNK